MVTDAELTSLSERAEFQRTILSDVMPKLITTDGFAGAYFDSLGSGALVVYVLRPGSSDMDQLRASLPQYQFPVTFKATDHTFEEINAAVQTLTSEWPRILGAEGAKFATIHGDKTTFRVVVSVPASAYETVNAARPEIERLISPFELDLVVGPAEADAACTDREHCTSPMRAGAIIRKGSTTGGRCTMAFHIQVGSDEQYLTAGHCGYSGSNSWYHKGLGSVGAELATLYPTWEVDAMRSQISDSQDSNLTYGWAGAVNQSDWPYIGVFVNASLGVSNTVFNGMVNSDYTSWTSDICNCTMYGASASISAVSGDSGSPIIDSNGSAVGIINTASGKFARVQEVLDAWSATMRQ